MNIVQLTEQLKDFSKDQLVSEMKRPSGIAPPYLVMSELQRRKRMESAHAAAANPQEPQTTVAEDVVNSAGVPQQGLGQIARAIAPKTDMAANTARQPTQTYAGGGLASVSTDLADYAPSNAMELMMRQALGGAGPSTRRGPRRAAPPTYAGSPHSRFNVALPEDTPRAPSTADDFRPVGADLSSRLQRAGFGSVVTPLEPSLDVAPTSDEALMAELDAIEMGQTVPTIPANAMEIIAQTDLGGDGPPRRLGTREGEQYPEPDSTTGWGAGERGESWMPAWWERVAPTWAGGIDASFPEGPDLDPNDPNLLPPEPETPPMPDVKAIASGSTGRSISTSLAQMGMGPTDEIEKEFTQNKWLALAKAGFAIMASDNPTLGGAIGEGGLYGLEALRQAQMDRDEAIKAQREEALAKATLAARMAGGSGGGGVKPPDVTDMVNYAKMLSERLATLKGGMVEMTPATIDEIRMLEAELAGLRSAIHASWGYGLPNANAGSPGGQTTFDVRQ